MTNLVSSKKRISTQQNTLLSYMSPMKKSLLCQKQDEIKQEKPENSQKLVQCELFWSKDGQDQKSVGQ